MVPALVLRHATAIVLRHATAMISTAHGLRQGRRLGHSVEGPKGIHENKKLTAT